MTGQATLVTLATLATAAATVTGAAMRTWALADQRRNAARDTGAASDHHTPSRAAHSHTDEGDPDA